ncbi:MAG: polyprenyl synthetase family protein [Desulfobacteraceae bacterium]|nr:polyprenyl synthetase family protein [Desulfobacteraceae bacterium]
MNNSGQEQGKFDLKAYLEEKRLLVDPRLAAILDCSRVDTRLCRAMTHSLMGSGKRLRPVLCMAAAEAVGRISDAVVQAACALEMIHTYSLIHDDLPAMDNDALRRGRPTCHVEFDETTAILAGDALLTLAFQTLADCAEDTDADPAAVLRAIKIISDAAGYRGMIEGQMQDMEAEGKNLSVEPLKKMHALKTGALIRASAACGAVLAGADQKQRSALLEYADNIGLAFQVTDDILNVNGDPEKMGKASGTDLKRGKSTYPSLMGTEQAFNYAENLVNNALQAVRIFDNKAQPLAELAGYILKRER